MADVAQRAQQQQVKEQTFIGSVLSFPFHFIGVMFLSLGGAILVDWLCLYFFWPEAGWHHAKGMNLAGCHRAFSPASWSRSPGIPRPGW